MCKQKCILKLSALKCLRSGKRADMKPIHLVLVLVQPVPAIKLHNVTHSPHGSPLSAASGKLQHSTQRQLKRKAKRQKTPLTCCAQHKRSVCVRCVVFACIRIFGLPILFCPKWRRLCRHRSSVCARAHNYHRRITVGPER